MNPNANSFQWNAQTTTTNNSNPNHHPNRNNIYNTNHNDPSSLMMGQNQNHHASNMMTMPTSMSSPHDYYHNANNPGVARDGYDDGGYYTTHHHPHPNEYHSSSTMDPYDDSDYNIMDGAGMGMGVGMGGNTVNLNPTTITTTHTTTNHQEEEYQIPGSFYPLTQPYMPHVQSAPISSIAIDPVMDALYVAGHTITLNKKRRHAMYSTPGSSSSNIDIGSCSGGDGSGGMNRNRNRTRMGSTTNTNTSSSNSTIGSMDQRASMIATHSFPDGMLYSAAAGHDEARKDVLDDIVTSIYASTSNNNSNHPSLSSSKRNNNLHVSSAQRKIPKHAYRPPYGRPLDQTQQTAFMMNMNLATNVNYPKRQINMGISNILPFHSTTTTTTGEESTNTTNHTKKEGYICTISPSSVRVHNRGGLLVCENKIEGLLTGTFHPGAYQAGFDDASIAANATHVTVGGISTRRNQNDRKCPNLYCLDLYSSTLKEVASHTVYSNNDSVGSGTGGSSSSGNNGSTCSITDIKTSHETGNLVAGCCDGTLRIFDGSWRGGNYMECARVKAHGGGVAQVAVSGNLICTTGYSSRNSSSIMGGGGGSSVGYNNNHHDFSSLYAFPDEHVLIFDIRYLGRGGIAHPFSGLNGGPRFVSFLTSQFGGQEVDSSSSDHRILVGSGQSDGGLQIITPFQGLMNGGESDMTNFINPPLNPDEGESITAMQVVGKDLAIGTSLGNILQYRMAEDISRTLTAPKETIVQEHQHGGYSGYSREISQESKSSFNVDVKESSYEKEQLELPSYELDPPPLSIDPLALQANSHHAETTSHSIFNSYILNNEPYLSSLVDEMGKPSPYSFGILTDSVIKQSNKRMLSKPLLDLVDTEKNENDFLVSIPASKLDLDLGLYKEGDFPNSNKLLHGGEISSKCYDNKADPRKREKRDQYGRKIEQDVQLPRRYAGKNRQKKSRFCTFDVSSLNNTLYPGWDYSGPNSYTCSVLLLLYFVPEIRSAMLNSQLRNFDSAISGKRGGKSLDGLLCIELGFLFHQIDCLASHGMVYPKSPGEKQDSCRNIIGAFVPSNFLSTFMTMPEASALALLDGNPAATEVQRRPEAFYRFLLHHLDGELSTTNMSKRQGSKKHVIGGKKFNLIDSLYGMNAVSMNEFVNEGAGSESVTLTRSNTVDLAYDAFISKTEESTSLPDFGELLRFSLCKDVPLRAWCNSTQDYETVVQRKIVTSLPVIMSLSCACAGANGEDRLPIWRKSEDDHNHWLPEMIEVEIEDNGNVVTRQLRGKEWEEFKGEGLPKRITNKVKHATFDIEEGQRLVRYQLQSVVTFINNDIGAESKDHRGHHVLHVRVPKSYKREVLLNQMEITKKHLSSLSMNNSEKHLNLTRNVTRQDLEKRIEKIEQKLQSMESDEITHEWVLFNGPNVTSTVVDDALAFHVSFKEPCIITYRQVGEVSNTITPSKVEIPPSVMSSPNHIDMHEFSNFIAFDAEFVQVQHEDSILTATGSKMILREGRNALGRMSLIDCRTGRTILDDHVLPREPVVDYLTRFSGIKPSDLDPKSSPYHLISSRHAYLKMRFLVERGCIFVGHGLSQDFLTVNIFVPPSQIIDTTDIFHLERRRLISLRFLVNYLLGKDMQQDVHDSIEDSRAACELYMRALELKKEGLFDKVLHEIYECGQRIDWKVGELRKTGQLERR